MKKTGVCPSPSLCLGAMLLLAGPHSPQPAAAQGLPPVNLGATSFLDGGPPAGSGVYLSQYFQYFDSNRFLDGDGRTIPFPDADLEVWTSLTQVIIAWDKHVVSGAKFALDIMLPVVGIDLDFGAPGSFPRDSGSGLGDLLIGTALQFDPIMGKQGPRFIHRFEAQFIFPTGKYDEESDVNPGSNFFSFDPYWAGTLFVTPRLTTSYRAHYLWNDENDDPPRSLRNTGIERTRAGQAFHTNFAIAYEVKPKKLRLGLNGYFLKQISDSQANGNDLPGREQVLGVGPGLLWSFSQTRHLFLNLYLESDVKGRPEGDRLNLRYVHRF